MHADSKDALPLGRVFTLAPPAAGWPAGWRCLANLSVATKSLLSPAFGLAILILTGIGGWWMAEEQQQQHSAAIERIRAPYRMMTELPAELADIQKSLYLASIWSILGVEDSELDRLHQALTRQLASFHRLTVILRLDASVLGEGFVAQFDRYEKMLNAAAALSRRNPTLGVTAARGTEEQYQQLLAMVDTLIADWDEDLRGQARVLADSTRSLAKRFLVAIAVSVIVATTIGMICARDVSRPMLAIVKALDRLRLGDLGVEVGIAGRQDEIGRVAQSVSEFRDALVHNRGLEEERAAITSELERLAFRDVLTGLGNRTLFQRHIARAFGIDESSGAGPDAVGACGDVALLMIDLDRFKEINDALGHDVGDAVLCQVARRLEAAVRSADCLYRLGSDEFAIICQPALDTAEMSALSARVIGGLRQPIQLDERAIAIGASIGIANAQGTGGDPALLVRHADLALDAAKHAGRDSHRFFEAAMYDQIQRRRFIELELRDAVESCKLELFYQPQVDLASGRTIAFEVLLRWRHETEGWIDPSEFIPVAEQCDLILKVGRWVIEEAFRQIDRWLADGLEPLPIAVNVSAHQFRDEAFLELAESLMAERAAGSPKVTLELTEWVFAGRDLRVMAATFDRLRAAGYELSLDDFGTGYSSLGCLRGLPLQELKIDASFIRGMGNGEDLKSLVAGIVSLGHNLGLRVVAEGVERETERNHLRRIGCEVGQGYLFARPMPAAEATRVIEHMSEGRSRGTNPGAMNLIEDA